MSNRARIARLLICLGASAVVACGSDGGGTAPPAGSCHTAGTATGSFAAECNQCGQQHCDAELRDKSGSGYAQGYFGGDGACAAFNDCTCQCLASGASDPLQCAMTSCITKLDAACQAAAQKAEDCLQQKCATECR